MAQQTINIGTAPNDGTGTPLRTSFDYCNLNFTELYTAVGPSGNNIVVPGTATITGDLTVDTNVLKVDTSNNRVGIGTASPGFALDVQSATGTVIRIKGGSGSGQGGALYVTAAGSTSTFFAVGDRANIFGGTPDTTASIYTNTGVPLTFDVGGTTKATIDASGNVGVGVTPSAWNTYKAVQVGYASLGGYAGQDTVVGSNVYYESGFFKYISTAAACSYRQNSGGHNWNVAASGTAGNAITFTQAMTLTAAGNLAVGVSATGNRLDVQNSTDCTVLVKSTGANTNIAMDYVSSYGNHTIRKSGTAVWDFGVINDSSATPAFKVSNASAVGVQLVSGATSWTTLSDETVKDIIEPISNAVSKVGSLRSVIGKFKTDSEGTRRSFLIAQDVKSVLPEAVDVVGENNELGLRYTEVIPLLVAAIKELTAEVNALKNA